MHSRYGSTKMRSFICWSWCLEINQYVRIGTISFKALSDIFVGVDWHLIFSSVSESNARSAYYREISSVKGNILPPSGNSHPTLRRNTNFHGYVENSAQNSMFLLDAVAKWNFWVSGGGTAELELEAVICNESGWKAGSLSRSHYYFTMCGPPPTVMER